MTYTHIEAITFCRCLVICALTHTHTHMHAHISHGYGQWRAALPRGRAASLVSSHIFRVGGLRSAFAGGGGVELTGLWGFFSLSSQVHFVMQI